MRFRHSATFDPRKDALWLFKSSRYVSLPIEPPSRHGYCDGSLVSGLTASSTGRHADSRREILRNRIFDFLQKFRISRFHCHSHTMLPRVFPTLSTKGHEDPDHEADSSAAEQHKYDTGSVRDRDGSAVHIASCELIQTARR